MDAGSSCSSMYPSTPSSRTRSRSAEVGPNVTRSRRWSIAAGLGDPAIAAGPRTSRTEARNEIGPRIRTSVGREGCGDVYLIAAGCVSTIRGQAAPATARGGYARSEVSVLVKPGRMSRLAMRASIDEYLALSLRAHGLLQHVPLYDVSAVNLPGGGDGRT